MQRGMVRGIAAFRWGAWAWMAIVLTLERHQLQRPWLGWSLCFLAFAVTVAATLLATRAPEQLLRPPALIAELAVGVAVSFAGGFAYTHASTASVAFSSTRTLGSAWPLAGVLSWGVAFGGWAGAGAGVVIAIARFFAPIANGVHPSQFASAHWISLASTTLLYALAGAVAGYAANLLLRAENEVAEARAREEVARTLHDGVLQTLAVIERRTDSPDLARLARDQERELRAYLFGVVPGGNGKGAADLAVPVYEAVARFERTFGGRVDVVFAPDLPRLDGTRVHALAGAVGEALTNAGKHGGASRVTVYAEPGEDGGVTCSVRDDGSGFDVTSTAERVGLRSSIRGRIEGVAGRVQIESKPGSGTEVRLWVP